MFSIKTRLKSNRFVRNKILPKCRAIRGQGQWIKKSLKPLYWRIPMALNRGVMSVELQATGVGLFATLTQVLYLLVYCDRHKIIPHVRLSGSHYINPEIGPDWFDYYFENTAFSSTNNLRRRPRYTHYVDNLDELGIGGYFLPTFTDLGTTITDAHKIFFRYVQIKADILAAVDTFSATYFHERHVLGVHYRGTDKHSEAPRVSWESFHQALSDYLASHPEVNAIFVASDECSFIEKVKLHFSDIEVVTHEDNYRSDDGLAIHSASIKGDNYKKGRDAIINSLLLSKCSALMRTTSALSGWASILNPEIPVVLLNRPYDHTSWFPETEVLKVASVWPA